jgi:hypothetical protein
MNSAVSWMAQDAGTVWTQAGILIALMGNQQKFSLGKRITLFALC